MIKQAKDDERYYKHQRPELVACIEERPDNVILELGCGAGAMSDLIREQGKAAEIWGVEIVPEVAERASADSALTRVLCGNIEKLVDELPPAYFTHLMAGDVIEHLIDPWTTLAKLRATLRPGATVIASMPNIRNFSFLTKLTFAGKFEYKDEGVMDRHHLRFFARKDMAALFTGAGFTDIAIAPARPKLDPVSRLGRLLFGDFFVKSLLITARNPDRPR